MYAYFEANKYTVYFNANGGNTANPTSKTVTYDSTYGSLASVSRTGYTFNGWYTAASGGSKIDTTTKVSILSNQTLYAHWTVNSYNVSISAGAGGSVNKTSMSINYGGTNTFTATPSSGYYLESITCTNGYTTSGYSTGTSATGTQTITVNNNSKTDGSSCSVSFKILCPYSVGTYWDFNYTGGVQSFTVACTGTYKLEVYGAQGGTSNGGKGGYSSGNISVNRNTLLYVVVGGQPIIGVGDSGGYNGGGSGSSDSESVRGGGGGATNISKTNTILQNTSIGNLYIVAGGGGGGTVNQGGAKTSAIGGAGGGLTGGTGGNSGACIGTGGDCFERMAGGGSQNSGGVGGIGRDFIGNLYNGNSGNYGKGGDGNTWMPGGGGGYYGGGSAGVTANYTAGGGGGSGYIGGVTSGNMLNGQRSGNGFARITLMEIKS